MSQGRKQGRFFASSSANIQNYPADLITKVLQPYIDQRINIEKANEKTSEGIRRARALIQHINEELIKERQFTSQQIMWIMFDYVTRCAGTWLLDSGAAPLYSSKKLREKILAHFCGYLEISNKKIEQQENLLMQDMSSEVYQSCPPNAGDCVQAYVDLHDPVRLALIKHKLTSVTSEASDPAKVDFAHKLQTDLLVYLTSIKNKWSKAKDRDLVEKLKKMIDEQWLSLEKLSDLPLMWRIWEQLSLAKKENHGIFGDNHDCRLRVTRAMCDYLGIQQQVNETVQKTPNMNITLQVGLAYLDSLEDDEEKEIRVSLQFIANQLRQSPELTSSRRFGNNNNCV